MQHRFFWISGINIDNLFTFMFYIIQYLKAFVQKGRISLFGPIFIFCRIELIFARRACSDIKNIISQSFCWFTLYFQEITYAIYTLEIFYWMKNKRTFYFVASCLNQYKFYYSYHYADLLLLLRLSANE